MVLLLLLPAVQAGAQVTQRESSRPFSVIVAEWNRKLALIEDYVGGLDRGPARSEEFRQLADEVRASALAERARAERTIATLQRLSDALGPPPAEGAPPENSEIADQRKQYQDDLATYKGRLAQAELALTRVSELEDQISALFFERLISNLASRQPSPLAPDTWAKALPEAVRVLTMIAATPADWWQSLPPEERDWRLFLRNLALLAIALIVGLPLRRYLLKYLGRDPKIAEPTFARRLVGAIAEGLARGLIPAAIVGVVLLRAAGPASPISGPFAEIVSLACQSLILFILATALPRAALAPEVPSWRLADLSAENAQQIARLIGYLAAVYAIDTFFSRAIAVLPEGPALSSEFRSLYALVFNVMEAIGLLAILRRHLWTGQGPAEDADADAAEETKRTPDPNPQQERPGILELIRVVSGLLVLAALVGTVAGYVNFGTYVINNLLGTGVIGGLLYLLRGLLRDLLGVALRSALVVERLQVTQRARTLLRFWLQAFLDLGVWISAIFLLAPAWGVPAVPLAQWMLDAVVGFKIGNVTISLADLALALLIFLVGLGLIRWMQRGLAERVLPETRLDPGVQHSLAAGFGYIGFAVSAMVAISTVGIDLSNLAIIAGALSVGIGFGLQNVVNNFVSGLILLIERPIKVGDWVVVGSNEGTVKRIRVRATEIETFRRASVIIPNSELLSTSVVNWTHADRLGRAEIQVGVAYGSDVEQVRQILLDVGRANSQVTRWPPPYVMFRDFGDSSLVFELRCYLYDIGQIISVSTDLRFAIDKAFRENGIEIPFPQRDLHLKDLDRLADLVARRLDDQSGDSKAHEETPAGAESAPGPDSKN